MRELSLNVLDIAQNSISANAPLIEIEVLENTEKKELLIGIYDNGKGMTPEQVENVKDPFFTTRTTRKVGMGIPLFKLAAEQTGGHLTIESEVGKGTRVQAVFKTDSIDFTPLGDIITTLTVIIQGHPDVDYEYKHSTSKGEVILNTKEMREILGSDISLAEFEILEWIKNYLVESYSEIN